MDAKIKKITLDPAKYSKEGDIEKEPSAVITIEVPLDSEGQRETITRLMEYLAFEFVKADITHPQLPLFGEEQTTIDSPNDNKDE